MKNITKYINETSDDKSFKDKVKYSKSDMKKWIDTAKEGYEVYHYDDDNILLIYKKLNKKDDWGCDIEHIATYEIDKEILSTNDSTLFGH